MTDDGQPPDDARLDAAVSEATALRLAVEDLASAILGAVPQEEKRYKTLALLAIIGGPLLFVVTMAFAIKTTVDGAERTKQLKQGVACLLSDLDDHRHTNQYAHDTLAEKHGFGKIIGPDVIPLTKAQAERLKVACMPYVKQVAGDATNGGAQGDTAGGR